MKNYFFIFITCSLLLCCHHEQNEPIIPEEPEPEPEAPYVMPCGCGDEWYHEEITCNDDLPWDYPIKPETEEWDRMTYPEQLDACQIPEEVLTSLSTEDLTKICLQYPFLLETLFLGSHYEQGLNSIFRNFNGIRKLFQREDVAKELLKQYRYVIQISPESTREFSTLKIWALELILTRYQSSDDSKDNYMEIVQYLVCGYKKKLMYPEIFSNGLNFYARAIILLKINEKNLESIPQNGSNGVFQNGHCDELTERAINDLSCQYINQ